MKTVQNIDNSTLEAYALNKLEREQTEQISKLLAVNLELGEALEEVYIKLEERGYTPVL